MNAELIELGKRAVACRAGPGGPGDWHPFRWMSGMLLGNPRNGRIELRVDKPAMWTGLIPVLSDPATLGCLLALVREAYEDDSVVALRRYSGGYVEHYCGRHTGNGGEIAQLAFGPTEAAALVAALEAAPTS